MLLAAVLAGAVLSLSFHLLASPDEKNESSADRISVGLIDRDGSALSQDLADYLEHTLGFHVVRDNFYARDGAEEKCYQSGASAAQQAGEKSLPCPAENLANLLIDRKISAIIEIPDGFYDGAANADVNEPAVTTLDDYENAAFIEVYLNSYMQGVQVMSDAACGEETLFAQMLSSQRKTDEIKIAELEQESPDVQKAFVFAEGFMLMVVAGLMFFVSWFVMTDRNEGAYDRITASPARPAEYIVGTAAFGILCGMLANLILTLCIYLRQSEIAAPFWVTFGGGGLFVLFSVGLSVMLALVIRSNMALMTVGIGYTVLGCMLGGAWFPIADNLGAVGNAAKIFPQYWFMSMLRGANPDYNYLPPLCVLALFVLLIYLISAVIHAHGRQFR